MSKSSEINFSGQEHVETVESTELHADNTGTIQIPDGHHVGNATLSQDGQDLILKFSDSDQFSIKDYFSHSEPSTIQDSAGSSLNENLVNSFLESSPQYAQLGAMSDESPVGAVEELKGKATLTHTDGSTEDVTLGTPIYQGDVIETSNDGAVNIVFVDETSMGISQNARISIDNYEFDAKTENGETDISVLRGVFVYTSGLIGRDDPDDVTIETPVGSIGIRGTIIAGNINPKGESEVSVLEGAIVVSNGTGETTLSQQFETVKLSGFQNNIEYKGVETANDIGKTYGSVRDVLPKLFSSINDAAKEVENSVEKDKIEKTEASEENTESSDKTIEEPSTELIQEDIDFAPTEDLSLGTSQQEIQTSDNNSTHEIQNTNKKNSDNFKFSNYFSRYEAENFTGTPEITGYIKPIFEQTKEGTVVGTFVVNGYPAGTTLSLNESGETNNFSINRVSGTNKFEVTLNADLGNATGTFTTIEIVATRPNGRTKSVTSETLIIQDAVVNLNTPDGYDYEVSTGQTLLDGIHVKDFDGDGDLGNDPSNTDYAVIKNNSNHDIDGQVYVYNDSNRTNTLAHTPTGASSIKWSEIAFAEDINNDGYSDIVGLTYGTGAGAGAGATDYGIIYGGDSSASVAISHINFSSTLPTSIASAGDFSVGEGSDFVVGASAENSGDGIVIVQYGDNSSIFTLNGTGTEGLGKSVHGISDFNGDGVSDIMATNSNNEAYVIFGADGIGDNPLNTSTAGSGRLTKISDTSFGTMVAAEAAGDINGDGFDDIAISYDDGTNINTYVVYGHNASTDLDLDYLENPDYALKINHNAVLGTDDYQITAMGDIDGDGFDDLQVGIKGGEQFIVRGAAGGSAHAIVTDGSEQDANEVNGKITASNDYQSLVGDVDFNDGGNTGIRMSGGSGDSTFGVNDSVFTRIDGGDGFDTIKLVHSGSTLDFSSLQYEHIQQIEECEFDNSNQIMTLTANNIFNMLKSSDNSELRITGNGTLNINTNKTILNIENSHQDTVDALNQVGSGASKQNDETIEGNTYTHFSIGGYQLYIDTDITTTIV